MTRHTLTDTDTLPGHVARIDVLRDAEEARSSTYPGSPEAAQILDITVDGHLPTSEQSTAIEAAWPEERLLEETNDTQRDRADDAGDHALHLQREDC